MLIAKVIFWDVEHGHSTYIQTPNNRHVVIDLGTGSYGSDKEFSPLKYLKNVYGVDQLDYVIITHPHIDHIDDILNFDSMNPKVLLRTKNLDRQSLLENVTDKDKPKLEKYFEISDRYTTPVQKESPDYPNNPNNWGGLEIKNFTPFKEPQSNINNNSSITLFLLAGIKILIPGDNERFSWEKIFEDEKFKKYSKDIDVLLAPHHGRDSGYEIDVMKHINPRLTVISDGPYSDTSATDRYKSISRGWNVINKNSQKERRFCLTTRKDGVVYIEFGIDDNSQNFLYVKKGR